MERSPTLSALDPRRGLSLTVVMLVLFAVVAAVPCLLLGVSEVNRARQTALERAERERAVWLGALTLQAQSWVMPPLDATQVLAHLAATQPVVNATVFNPLIAAQRQHFRSAFMCLVLDVDGKVVAADPPVASKDQTPMVGRDYSDRPYFGLMKRTLEPYISPVMVGRSSGVNTIVVAAPVVRGGVFGGLALCSLGLTALHDAVAGLAGPDGPQLLLVDHQDQRLVMHPDAARVGEALVDKAFFAEALGEPGATRRTGPDGKPVLVSAQRSTNPRLRWTSMVVQQEAEVMRSAAATSQSVLLNLALAFALACLAALLFARWLIRPFPGLVRLAEAAGRLQLDVRAAAPRRGETREVLRLRAALTGTLETLRSNLGSLADTTQSIDRAVDRISDSNRRVTRGSARTLEVARGVDEAAHAIRVSAAATGADLQALSGAANVSAEVATGLREQSAAVSAAVRTLSAAVTATRDLAASQHSAVTAMAGAAAAAAATLEDTASAMADVDASTRSIEQAAAEAAALSQAVATEAQEGALAVRQSIAGMSDIQVSTAQAAEAMKLLDARIEDVGRVANVIDRIAYTTKLLALNAGILAARSGDAGSGFSVVAEEIRGLADQTATSTREIEQMIERVRAASRDARAAVGAGDESVLRGVELSQAAEAALQRILQSSASSAEQSQSIAGFTGRQAQRTRSAAASTRGLTTRVKEMAQSADRQAADAERMTARAREMHEVMKQLEDAVGVQAQRADKASAAATTTRQAAATLNTAQKHQDALVERVSRSAQLIQEAVAGQKAAADALGGVVDGLLQQSQALRQKAGGLGGRPGP